MRPTEPPSFWLFKGSWQVYSSQTKQKEKKKAPTGVNRYETVQQQFVSVAKGLLPHADYSDVRKQQIFKSLCSLLFGNGMSPFSFAAPSGFLNNIGVRKQYCGFSPPCYLVTQIPRDWSYCTPLGTDYLLPQKGSTFTAQRQLRHFSKHPQSITFSTSAGVTVTNWPPNRGNSAIPHLPTQSPLPCAQQRCLCHTVAHVCILKQKLAEGLLPVVRPVIKVC